MELPAPGQIFQRKYKLQEILGRGGFAAVYRATDVEIGRDVAIKILAPSEEGYSQGVAARFMREARVIGSFQDPHTITMFEFGTTDDGLLFMVFEYVRGNDLSDVIRSRGPLQQHEVIHIMRQLLQSLREAHAANVLHRDIKPANILVYDYMGDANRVKLLDFGIAKAVAGEDGINLTREGAMIGTPRYMSPEQIYGGELGPESDLYSLGLVAHEMLVGRPAITGTTSKEMLRAQLADAPVRLPRGTVAATDAMCQIIDRLTSRDPTQRFPTAADVSQALEWVEQNDHEAPPQVQPGMRPASGISPAYITPREGPRSEEIAGRSGERAWEMSGQQQRMSGPLQPPGPGMGSGQRLPTGYSGANPAYVPQSTMRERSGPLPGRPPTYEVPQQPGQEPMDDGDDLSLGTILGAGLGAAALVVGLLMLMSYLANREDTPQPQPQPEPAPKTAPAPAE